MACSISTAFGYGNAEGDHAWWRVGYYGPWQLMPPMGIVITNAPGPMEIEVVLTRDGEEICSQQVMWPGTLTAVEEPAEVSWGLLKSLYGE